MSEYKVYGEEWEKEMMKFTKEELISMLRHREELLKEVRQVCFPNLK